MLSCQWVCECVYTAHEVPDIAAGQRKVKGTQQQQCPHMQSKCAGKATSIGGLARDESLLAYLSVYSISGELSCACGRLKLNYAPVFIISCSILCKQQLNEKQKLSLGCFGKLWI